MDGAFTQQPRLERAVAEVKAMLPPDAAGDVDLELEGAAYFGRYVGLPPLLEWLEDGRMMRLKSPLSFLRPDETEWPVPAGIEVDGASIPRVFWTVTGGPFSGRYRNASIVHDHYCVVKERSWRDTHRMFYEGMRCSGVPELKAKAMFYAVHRFGPRWADPTESVLETAVAPAPAPTEADADSIKADVRKIIEENPDLETIEAMADCRDPQAGGG